MVPGLNLEEYSILPKRGGVPRYMYPGYAFSRHTALPDAQLPDSIAKSTKSAVIIIQVDLQRLVAWERQGRFHTQSLGREPGFVYMFSLDGQPLRAS